MLCYVGGMVGVVVVVVVIVVMLWRLVLGVSALI